MGYVQGVHQHDTYNAGDVRVRSNFGVGVFLLAGSECVDGRGWQEV